MAHEITENTVIDLGVSKGGTATKIHLEGDQVITQQTFDAEPHLKYAEDARIQTAGKNWGEGRLVGHIPPAFYAKIILIKDRQERDKAIRAFLRENPAFVMFDRFKP